MKKEKFPIRSILRAAPNCTLLAYDFSQAESWIVAHLANSETMKQALRRAGTKFDIHYTSTRGMFNYTDDVIPTSDERYMGKKFNHSCSYGTSAMMVAHMINSESIYPPYMSISISDAKKLHQKWLDLYPEIPRWWMDIQRALAPERKLRTVYGHERTFFGRWGPELFKEAYAYIPQSTVADHCMGAIQPELGIPGGVVGIDEQLVVPSNEEIKIVNSSHDSVILEVPLTLVSEVSEKVYHLLHRPLMINGETFKIPVDCDVGEVWDKNKMDSLKFAA